MLEQISHLQFTQLHWVKKKHLSPIVWAINVLCTSHPVYGSFVIRARNDEDSYVHIKTFRRMFIAAAFHNNQKIETTNKFNRWIDEQIATFIQWNTFQK